MILCRSPIEDGEAPAASSSSGGFPRFHDFQRLLPHLRFHTYAKLCLWLSPSSPQRGGTDTWGNEVSSWDAFSIIASALSHHYFHSLESERQFRACLFICLFLSVDPSQHSFMHSSCTVLHMARDRLLCLVQGLFSTAASTPAYFNSSAQAVSLPVDQWLHSTNPQKRSEIEKDINT